MRDSNLISEEYKTRLEEVLNQSWKIFKSQFVCSRHEINTEAPFQHHFAQIIKNVGDLYSIESNDLFKVDLESKIGNVKGKSKYYDISCQFVDRIKCVIELKFKLKRQGAQDWARIDSYVDIEALEFVVPQYFNFGKFYFITDDTAYINKSTRGGSGTTFACMTALNQNQINY